MGWQQRLGVREFSNCIIYSFKYSLEDSGVSEVGARPRAEPGWG